MHQLSWYHFHSATCVGRQISEGKVSLRWPVSGHTAAQTGGAAAALKRSQLTTEGGCSKSTPLQRWRPFGPHPMACWVGDTLEVTWCHTCQKVAGGRFVVTTFRQELCFLCCENNNKSKKCPLWAGSSR